MNTIGIFGHRGARGLAPENTLAGLGLVAELGLTGVEFDIGLSADGIAVVHHDPRPNPDVARGAGGAYAPAGGPTLHDLTYAQIATYDVGRLRDGSDYAARYPDQRAIDGARIPTLDAALQALGRCDLLIEVKTFPDRPDLTAPPALMAAAVTEALRRAGAVERAVLFAFDWRVLREAALLEPGLRRCCLTEPDTVRQDSPWLDGLDLGQFDGQVPRAVVATGATCWAPFHASLDEAQLAQAKAIGLAVLPWTVNTPDAFERMIALGVDGMISDRPDLARRAVEAAGLRVAPPGLVGNLAAPVKP